MIKLFQRIRQKLVNKGKLRSYFLYALGEIILVVVGILIAISLNNSNQNKIAQVDLQDKLKKIREEIYQDSLNFEYIIEYNNQRIETIEKMTNLTDENINFDDYQKIIEFLSKESGHTKTFSPNAQTYMGIINSGEFSKIRNDSLKNKISFLYSYYEHMSKFNYSAIEHLQSFNKKLYSNGILRAKYIDEMVDGKLKEDGFLYFQNMLKDPYQKIIFENSLYQEKEVCESVIRRCQQTFGAMNGLPLKPTGK